MSSSSYLGHGAKYWADRYFELQTQTRMPDDSSAIEWQEKYLNLEKSCSLYQSKIADLRTEVEYLRTKVPSESTPYKKHPVEANSIEKLQQLLSEGQKAIKELDTKYGKVTDELAVLKEDNAKLQNQLATAKDELELHAQKRSGRYVKYIVFFLLLSVVSFFIGAFWGNSTLILSIEFIPCLIFLAVGIVFSYAFCASKYTEDIKAQKNSFNDSLSRQKEAFVQDLSALVNGLDLLSLSNAPESCYLDPKGLPHMIVDGEDICTVSFAPSGEVFHSQKNPCLKYLITANIAHLTPCRACTRCYPTTPELSWYGRCLSNAVILQRYGIKIHIPLSSDEAVHRPQTSSKYFAELGTDSASWKKRSLDSLIRNQLSITSAQK